MEARRGCLEIRRHPFRPSIFDASSLENFYASCDPLHRRSILPQKARSCRSPVTAWQRIVNRVRRNTLSIATGLLVIRSFCKCSANSALPYFESSRINPNPKYFKSPGESFILLDCWRYSPLPTCHFIGIKCCRTRHSFRHPSGLKIFLRLEAIRS